jgi:hypothetical protein
MHRAPDGNSPGANFCALGAEHPAKIQISPYAVVRESFAHAGRTNGVSDEHENIAIRVEVNEDEKTAVILIPWQRLAAMDGADVLDWLARAAKVRAEWEKKGYRCN